MSEITPVTHTEKVVAGEVTPVTHFEKVIAEYGGGSVYDKLEAGTNILIEETADGKAKISASGEVSSEDTVARAAIAEMKDGTNIDSFGDVETALATKADTSTTYTKTEVDTALGSKQDTISDLSTIRSGAALGATAVQPEAGKGLSTNDYTDAEKSKLAGIAEGAEVNVQSNWTQTTTTADDYIKNKPTLGTAAALDVAASGNASTSQVVKGNDTRLSDARNAADVSAWAKAADKPSYAGSEIPLTGYSEAQSKASVAATDTTNEAIGKLEYRVESNENNILTVANYGGGINVADISKTTFTTDTSGSFTTSLVDDIYTLTGTTTSAGFFNIYYSGNSSELTVPEGDWIVYPYPLTTAIQLQGAINGTISCYGDVNGFMRMNIAEGSTGTWIRMNYGANRDLDGISFRLMIIPKSIYDSGLIPNQPYAPTNAELYEMIKALQS